jgi:hypothetical protein
MQPQPYAWRVLRVDQTVWQLPDMPPILLDSTHDVLWTRAVITPEGPLLLYFATPLGDRLIAFAQALNGWEHRAVVDIQELVPEHLVFEQCVEVLVRVSRVADVPLLIHMTEGWAGLRDGITQRLVMPHVTRTLLWDDCLFLW